MSEGEHYLSVENVTQYIIEISIQKEVSRIISNCSCKTISIKNLVRDYLKRNIISNKLDLGHYSYPDYVPMEFWGSNTKIMRIVNKK